VYMGGGRRRKRKFPFCGVRPRDRLRAAMMQVPPPPPQHTTDAPPPPTPPGTD